MKKLLVLLMAGIMVFSLAACGESSEDVATEEPKDTIQFPYEPTPGSITIGDYTLSAELIPFDEPLLMTSNDDTDMELLGDTLYIADGDKTIKVYTFDGSALTFVKDLNIENGDGIAVDGNGNIYADGGVFEAKIYDADGNETGEAITSGYYYASKTEDFALAYFTGGSEVTKISGGAAEPWVISGINTAEQQGPFTMISQIEIQGDHVLVGGEDEDKYLMAAYDTQGNELMVSQENLNGTLPNALAETENGYISTSVDTINLIAKDGTLIGDESDSDDLFGIDATNWIYKLITLDDGSVLALVKSSKADVESKQIFLYKITGF